MVISKKFDDDILILGIIGSIDVEGREYLANELYEILNNNNTKKCVIDFAEVNYIGSIGVGTILNIYRNFVSHGGRLCLINLLPHLRKLFVITQLDKIIPIYNKLENAKEYLNKKMD